MLVIITFALFLYFVIYFYNKRSVCNIQKNNSYINTTSYMVYIAFVICIPLIIILILFLSLGSYINEFFINIYINKTFIDKKYDLYILLEHLTLVKSIVALKYDITANNFMKLSKVFTNAELLKIYYYQEKIHTVLYIVRISVVICAVSLSLWIFNPLKNASIKLNHQAYKLIKYLCVFIALFSFFITIGVVISLFIETVKFFNSVSIINFIFGTTWNPSLGEARPQENFGLLPLLLGTVLIAVIATLVAVIGGVAIALILSFFLQSKSKFKYILKQVVDILAGIPTIVYGFFASTTLAPFVLNISSFLHIGIEQGAALIVGLVVGIMLVPSITSVLYDSISNISKNLINSAYGLGMMKHEIILHIVLPKISVNIIYAVLIAFSRAIGETMIVLLVSGLTAKLSFNPLVAVSTITTQIALIIQGDQSFDSITTHSAFALGFVLFIITLLLNLVTLKIMNYFAGKNR